MQPIGVHEMERLRAQGTLVIDVLPEESYERRHIPGAMNVPVERNDFLEKIQDVVPDKQTPVIVYCANKQCEASPTAARKMDKMGYENVYDFEEGVAGWRQAGHTLSGEPAHIDAR